jgi:signal transduction histidine kinase
MTKNILSQLNIIAQCRRYDLPLSRCPQVLFIVMGVIIILSSLSLYAFGQHYISDPRLVALIVLLISIFLLIIAFFVIKGFEKLAEASRMKSEFIDIVSHQLRTPLTNLKWAIDYLKKKDSKRFGPKEMSYYEIVQENSQRMEGLINHLLTIAKLKAGKAIFRKQKFSLEKLTKEIVSSFLSFARASNIEIEVGAQDNLPEAVGDPSQIKIVIENLIDNAIHYTKGPGKINIVLKRAGENILFKIRDSGMGIPQEDQKYVFDKFFRSKKAVESQTQGSGLGLYITKLIIEKSGGRIWFESKEGEGSTFYFTLPIK